MQCQHFSSLFIIIYFRYHYCYKEGPTSKIGGKYFLSLLPVCRKDKTIVKLLKKGVQINKKSYEGKTALHCACRLWNPEIASTLLEHGADVKIVDIYGQMLLINANIRIAEILVKDLAKMRFEC